MSDLKLRRAADEARRRWVSKMFLEFMDREPTEQELDNMGKIGFITAFELGAAWQKTQSDLPVKERCCDNGLFGEEHDCQKKCGAV